MGARQGPDEESGAGARSKSQGAHARSVQWSSSPQPHDRVSDLDISQTDALESMLPTLPTAIQPTGFKFIVTVHRAFTSALPPLAPPPTTQVMFLCHIDADQLFDPLALVCYDPQ